MLFDLKADPREEHNLYEVKLERALAMRGAMEARVKKLPRPDEAADVSLSAVRIHRRGQHRPRLDLMNGWPLRLR